MMIKSRIVKEPTNTVGKYQYWRIVSLFGIDVYATQLFYRMEQQ